MTGPELQEKLITLFGPSKTVDRAAQALRMGRSTLFKQISDRPLVYGPVAAAVDLALACPEEHRPPEWRKEMLE